MVVKKNHHVGLAWFQRVTPLDSRPRLSLLEGIGHPETKRFAKPPPKWTKSVVVSYEGSPGSFPGFFKNDVPSETFKKHKNFQIFCVFFIFDIASYPSVLVMITFKYMIQYVSLS